jgi:hypothetical protein
MARMIPDIDPSTVEHSSEEPVYRALRDQLSDDHLVLHSYPWLRPWRDNGALAEGEADFVVLHPEKGMLVLEVKGGESIRHDGKRWYRQTRNGLEEFKDPFVQGRRNVHALLDIARERSGGRIRKDSLTYGYAAVFPHMDYEGHTPPNADPAIVISRRHLPYLEQAIQTAYRAWTTDPRALRPDHYRMLVEDCLMPQFGIFRPVGADIDGATQQLLELTEHQAQVFEGLYAQDRVVVEGVAGSGKTFLALQRALSFARAGKRTLMVCYNRELAAWLRHQVESDPTTVEFRHLLVIRNFHALASQLAAQARIPFRTANGGPQTENFWDNEVPDLLEQAVLALETEGSDVRYDALVVDEAQDFPTGWWYALTEALLSTPVAPIYAFLDPHQCLRGKAEKPPIDFQTRFTLGTNCRNTRKIAAASSALLALECQFFTKAPAGADLRLLRAPSDRQQKGLVLEAVRRLIEQDSVKPQQIVLIGPSAKANGSLADVSSIAGIPLVTSAEGWRAGHGILVTTARSFKGLESDVVVIYDLGEFGHLFRKEDLYVASTRPKALLVVIAHGGEVRLAMEQAVRAASVGT